MIAKLQNTKVLRIVIFGALAAMVILPRILGLFYLTVIPETMIGEEGLQQALVYLQHFLVIDIICIILFVLYSLLSFFVTVCYILAATPVKHKILAVFILVCMLFFGFALIIPHASGMDVQGERFSDNSLIHTVKLMKAIKEDLQSEPVEAYASTELSLWESEKEINPGIRSMKDFEITEYELHTKDWKVKWQLSEEDYLLLKRYFIGYGLEYQVFCYPNSGILYDIAVNGDDEEQSDL